MPFSGNSIDTNVLASLSRRAGPEVTSAIQQASAKTGVDFAYLMEKAATESNFDADAKAPTSSASGLYQFIESTWLQMIDRYGAKHGLGQYADKINDQGKVSSPSARREILALRNDPEIASLMAGEFASENRQTLIRSGIDADKIGSTELYLAHFLGAGAASEFIKGMRDNPLTPAADLFPRAAKTNKNVFYNSKTHQARSLAEVYGFFDRKFDSGQPIPPTHGQPPAALSTVAESGGASGAGVRGAISGNSLAWMEYGDHPRDLVALLEDSAQQQQLPWARPSTRLPGSLVSNPVALMLMARCDTGDADSRGL